MNSSNFEILPQTAKTEIEALWKERLSSTLQCLSIDRHQGTITISKVDKFEYQTELNIISCELHNQSIPLCFVLRKVEFQNGFTIDSNDVPLEGEHSIIKQHKIVACGKVPIYYCFCSGLLHFKS